MRSENSAVELRVRRRAHGLGFRYRLHLKTLPGRPDLVFRKYRLALFVHGCFWHRHSGCPLARIPKSRVEFWTEKLEGNRIRDLAQQSRLDELEWRWAVIWECQTQDRNGLDRLLRETISGGRDAIR